MGDGLTLSDRAACARGIRPDLFTSTSYLDHRIAANICARCPVTQLCIRIVQPRQSRFDGTAGGYYWLDGVNMTARIASPAFSSVLSFRTIFTPNGLYAVQGALEGMLSPANLDPHGKMLYAWAAAESEVQFTLISAALEMPYAVVRVMPPVVARDAPRRLLDRVLRWPVRLRIDSSLAGVAV
jgi:hypothetical protein